LGDLTVPKQQTNHLPSIVGYDRFIMRKLNELPSDSCANNIEKSNIHNTKWANLGIKKIINNQ